MTKHTPGPWQANDQLGTMNVYTQEGVPIAFNTLARTATDPAEAEANARLIAAAPELLAHLAEFVEAWHEEMEGSREPDGIDPYAAGEYIAGMYSEVKALIAKATGPTA